jgi:hypothetical protein
MPKVSVLEKARKVKQLYQKYEGLRRISNDVSEKLGTPALPKVSSILLKKWRKSRS